MAHIYHRIDYEILRETLARDVPRLASDIEAWRSAQITPGAGQEPEHEDRHGATQRDSAGQDPQQHSGMTARGRELTCRIVSDR